MRISFRPELLDALEGYDGGRAVRDLVAGVTVAAVALPLAMAFAIASGLPPQAGLISAVVGGFLVSALGGSRVQIGGPAGAFIVIVYGIVERHGVGGLVVATALSGVLLFLMGLFRLGTLIRFVPVAVVIGFTNGIAVLIALSQLRDALGLTVPALPADALRMLAVLREHLHTLNGQAVAITLTGLAVIIAWQHGLPRLARRWPALRLPSRLPGSVVVLVLATVAVALADLQVDTIGSRFGGMPSTLPALQWPTFSFESARALVVPTLTLAFLGALESLLCARVADGMIDQRHKPNQELMAQGIANFATPFFGGMPVTGTIARTVTNVNSGASSPVAGMAHALTVLAVMLLAAPLAGHVPLAVLAAILLYVAWNMGDWRAFAQLHQFRLPYRITLLAVFVLTVVFDLTIAVEVGMFAACLTFIYRISSLSRIETLLASDLPALQGQGQDIGVHRMYGALFFGAVHQVEALAEDRGKRCRVLDLKNVIYIDSSGADCLLDLVRNCRKAGVQLHLCGLSHQALDIARRTGLLDSLPPTQLHPDLDTALRAVRDRTA